jgi:hypothetical protein
MYTSQAQSAAPSTNNSAPQSWWCLCCQNEQATNAPALASAFGGVAMSRTGGYNYMSAFAVVAPRPSGHQTYNGSVQNQATNNVPQAPAPGGVAMSRTGYISAAPMAAAPQSSSHAAHNDIVRNHNSTSHHQVVVASSAAGSHGSTSNTAIPLSQGRKQGALVASPSSILNRPLRRLAIEDIINSNGHPSPPLLQGTTRNPSNDSTSEGRNGWQAVVLCHSEEPPEQTPNKEAAPASPEFMPESPGLCVQSTEERPRSPPPISLESNPESSRSLPRLPEHNQMSPDIIHQLGTNEPFNTGISCSLLTMGFPEGMEPKAPTTRGYL